MAAQKLSNVWRARRKKDGKTFNGPLRATEMAANKDARQLGAAAAVSSERLQEVFDRLSGSLPFQAVTQNGSNWRARVKVSQATVCGPTRQSKAPAEEDARLLQQAQQISSAEVQNVAQRLQQEATGMRAEATVTKHGSGWRARVKGAQTQVNGPTRQSKAAAEVDAGRLQAAHQSSTEELYKPWLSGCSRKLLM